ncbi:MAG: alanine--tRNA ligase [Pseudomonadota bacterium]
MASLNDIRTTFLDYFARNGHEIVASSPLVPLNDPTLMFVNSGMVQFKNVFTGVEKRDYVRATTSQKCVRAGGKHNDLDNVGYTARHHTFFEMLGNFSFGDYFKDRAIELAWDLVTKDFGLDKDRLLVTVHASDEEAAGLWNKIAGLPDSRIIRIDSDDNWWRMGDTGPNGPCTEIFYDHGNHIWGGPPGSAEEDGDRFIEIWNLVFMQFETFADGSSKPLPKPSVDTGMGLERIGALLQGKHDNYDTDLMRALIEASAQATSSDPDGDGRMHHRVIADHLRSTSFLIADGVLPSNEGRGYVLRRIMRRAMRHGHLLGASDPLMFRLVPELVRQMGQAFPELNRAQALIEETLQSEEIRFRRTLDRGLGLLEAELESLAPDAPLPGETAFKLYDTYGFPLDLTQDALRERQRTVDTDGFDAAMEAQKAKARAAWSGSGDAAEESLWFDLREMHGATEFLGYEAEKAEGVILALIADGAVVDEAGEGTEVQILMNQTPFYGESGGQIGDRGRIRLGGGVAEVTTTRKKAGDLHVHVARVAEGVLRAGEAAELEVDHGYRTAIRANHSATHLLHEALRGTLGDHVAQRGSLVADDRLRFDFTHTKAVDLGELERIEREVNGYIRQNAEVSTRIMTPEEAQEAGARALFGEKYGDEVRVVSMGRRPEGEAGAAGPIYSLELCGGTHVVRTGDIGVFVVVGEGASSAGIRRVEALTGEAAFDYLSQQDHRLAETALALKARPEEVAARVRGLLEERKALEAELGELRRQVALGGSGSDGPGVEMLGDVPFLGQSLSGVEAKDLRGLIDAHKERLGSAAIVLVADTGGKAAVAAGVTPDLLERISAVDLVRAAVAELGGKGGGGRPDMAQGGGPDVSRIAPAVAAAAGVIRA